MKRQQGSISIEYAVTFLPFFVMVLVVIEVCRFMMTGSMLDVALSSTARQVVNIAPQQDVAEAIENNLLNQGFPLIDEQKLEVQAVYFDSLEALKNNRGTSAHNGQPFAEYTLTYPYQVLFIDAWSDSFDQLAEFERVVLVTHERNISYAP